MVCEGGMGETVAYGHRGVLWLDVRLEGIAGHGSSPHAGVNAFEHVVRIANRLLAMGARFKRVRTKHDTMGKKYQIPTITLGGTSGGGIKVNTIPDRFHFTIDRRLIPEEEVTRVKAEIEEIITDEVNRTPGLQVKIETLTGFNAGLTDRDARLCQAAREAVEQVLRKPAKLKLFGAFTDLHFFTNQGKCPAIGYGVEGAGLHGSAEYLVRRSLMETAQVYAELMMRME